MVALASALEEEHSELRVQERVRSPRASVARRIEKKQSRTGPDFMTPFGHAPGTLVGFHVPATGTRRWHSPWNLRGAGGAVIIRVIAQGLAPAHAR